MELVSQILSSPEFVALLIAVITAVIGFVGKSLRDLIGRKVTAEQLQLLMVIARQAVAVAEQTGIAATAEEKKAEAIRVAQVYLNAYGIKIDVGQISAAIEAAVFTELTQFEGAPEDVITGIAVDALDEEEVVAPA